MVVVDVVVLIVPTVFVSAGLVEEVCAVLVAGMEEVVWIEADVKGMVAVLEAIDVVDVECVVSIIHQSDFFYHMNIRSMSF